MAFSNRKRRLRHVSSQLFRYSRRAALEPARAARRAGAAELRSCWKYARDRASLAHAIVDLKEVTFIDQDGEKLLAEMRRAGAELIATGVECQYLLTTLGNRKSPSARGKAPQGEKNK